jgi:hypothetical protein
LYNLAEDPFESTNLAARQPRRLREMMQGLASQLETLGAQYPVAMPGESDPVHVIVP